jgi:hypothetical protein
MDKERRMASRSAIGRRSRRAVAVCVGLLTMAVVVGCGKSGQREIKGKLPVFPVKGKLMMDSKPMAGATIIFYPTHLFPPGASTQRPRATVDTDGNFRVSTYTNDDGAPAGDYKATVSWKGDQEGVPSEDRAELPEKAPQSVQYVRSSKLRIKVTEGDNMLPTWDLAELEPQASNTQ